MAVVKPLLTVDDIERMIRNGEIDPDREFELVNGEIVWMAPAHYPQTTICALITIELGPFAKRIGALLFDSSGGFRVGDRNHQLRAPDVSLVVKERRHIARAGSFQSEAPDLAVEVLSDDQMGRVYQRTKTGEYFAAGAKVIWFVDYRTHSVMVYEAGKSEFTVYSESDYITLDQIAPGFSCRVSEFFPD